MKCVVEKKTGKVRRVSDGYAQTLIRSKEFEFTPKKTKTVAFCCEKCGTAYGSLEQPEICSAEIVSKSKKKKCGGKVFTSTVRYVKSW